MPIKKQWIKNKQMVSKVDNFSLNFSILNLHLLRNTFIEKNNCIYYYLMMG